jgi:UDP-N-acetylmuramoyl-L-alanyl-D-glutamate--2,6-diaminopimelate ligase
MKHKLQKIFSDYGVSGLTCDSRNVRSKDAFVAIKGEKFDGNEYIDAVLEKGAALVLTDDASRTGDKVVFVEDAREAISLAAGLLYPRLPKNIVAVTGTNGKSSVVSYVHQILDLLGRSSALMGTLGIESNQKLPADYVKTRSSLTTSDPIIFRKNLQMLADAGVDYLAFEASSHGLDQKRLGDVQVKSAAFTSFSQDHLDYHQTMENYLQAKLQLFSKHLLPGANAVINGDMDSVNDVQKFLDERKISYSLVGVNIAPSKDNLKITRCVQSLLGQDIGFEFMGDLYEFKTQIVGSFQANNILIATKLVHNLGVAIAKIVEILPKIKAVTGRLQRVTEAEHEFQVFVDYAHTPDALEKSLQELKYLKQPSGKLYVVFGCGGDRDPSKRPIMGKIAVKIADRVIITDDNPRGEDPAKIRANIRSGGISAEEIGDRGRAIADTIARLEKNDILLIAGKGHEDYQIIGDKIIDFSDIEIAKTILQR